MQILPDGEVNMSSEMLEALSIPAKDAEEKKPITGRQPKVPWH